jgi:VanZ family protein
MNPLGEMQIRRFTRAAGWILIIVIAVLSVVPPAQRPVTGVASSNFEHLAIYLTTGLLLAIGYRDRLSAVVAGLLMFAGLIELVQLFVPGRHARFSDFFIDCVASAAGVALVALGTRIFQRIFSRPERM